jgi:hypothetical protein
VGKTLKERLGLSPVGGALKKLSDLRTEVATAAISVDRRNSLEAIIADHELRLRGTGDRKANIKAFDLAATDIRTKLKQDDDLHGDAIKRLTAKANACETTMFGALRTKVREAGLSSTDLPALAQYDQVYSLAYKTVWDAKTTNDANAAAAEFEKKSDECLRNAQGALAKVDQLIQSGKTRKADEKRIADALAETGVIVDTITLASGSADRAASMVSEKNTLAATYQFGPGDAADGAKKAEALLATAKLAAKQVETETTQALDPLKQRLAKLKQDAESLRKTKMALTGKDVGLGFVLPLPLEGLTAYWERLDANFALADRAIADKLPLSGFPYLESLCVKAETMLQNIRDYDVSKQDHLDEAIAKLADLTKRHRLKFFDTDLLKYNPKNANVLRAQYLNYKEDCDKKTPAEIITYVDDLVEAATKAKTEADRLKLFCEDAAKTLANAQTELKTLDKEIKKLPKDQREGHKTFHGEYAIAVDELKAALDFSNGPDEAKITRQVKLLPALLEQIKPGGTLDQTAFLASQKDGLAQEEQAKTDKKNTRLTVKGVRKLFKETKTAVQEAPLGDLNEIDAIERSLDALEASYKGMQADQVMLRAGTLETKLERLKAIPGGGAVRARGKLDDDRKDFKSALDALTSELGKITAKINSDYDGDGKDEAARLVTAAQSALAPPATAITQAVDIFINNGTPDKLPERLKGREAGLIAIRNYRALITKNSVLAKLDEDDPFTNGALATLRSALNGLELNILRGI